MQRLLVPLCCSVWVVAACGSSAEQVQLRQLANDLQAMRGDLTRQQAHLAELSNQVFLLSDEVSSARRLEAHAEVPALEVVHLSPPGARSPAEPRQEEPAVDVDLSAYEEPHSSDKLAVKPLPPPPRTPRHDAEADKLFNAALTAFREGAAKSAISQLKDFVARFPSHPYADNALFWLGEAYFEGGDYAQAARAFGEVLSKYRHSRKVPDALLKMGIAYERLGQHATAHKAFSDLVESYPNSALAELARSRLHSAGGGS